MVQDVESAVSAPKFPENSKRLSVQPVKTGETARRKSKSWRICMNVNQLNEYFSGSFKFIEWR